MVSFVPRHVDIECRAEGVLRQRGRAAAHEARLEAATKRKNSSPKLGAGMAACAAIASNAPFGAGVGTAGRRVRANFSALYQRLTRPFHGLLRSSRPTTLVALACGAK